jgi:hypothetical protein
MKVVSGMRHLSISYFNKEAATDVRVGVGRVVVVHVKQAPVQVLVIVTTNV